jgi:hypothetical protein
MDYFLSLPDDQRLEFEIRVNRLVFVTLGGNPQRVREFIECMHALNVKSPQVDAVIWLMEENIKDEEEQFA